MSRKSAIQSLHPHPAHWRGGRITTRTVRALGKALQLRKQRIAEARRRAFLQWNHMVSHNRRVMESRELAEALGREADPSLQEFSVQPFADRHAELCELQRQLRRIG